MDSALDLVAIQKELVAANLDGWLFYDHHFRDPIAYRVLKVRPSLCTRRWYYLIPAVGQPSKLTHRIERENLDGLPGARRLYSAWTEQREQLRRMLEGKHRVAMQYSPLNDVPYVGLVDAGTVELIRSFGVELVSSGDLVQMFEARWSPEALASHLEAGKAIHGIVRQAFQLIRERVQAGHEVTEYELQQEILKWFSDRGLVTDEPPIVAVNVHSANPHYLPAAASSLPIRANDFVLLDLWGKLQKPGAVYFDITWTGYVAEQVPGPYQDVFNLVREARDAAVACVHQAFEKGQELRGFQVDDAAREVIRKAGYADHFIHRTGHSIGEEVHGNGANMDNYECRDTRRVIPQTGFSIEPGIYLKNFGVRSEVNVYVESNSARVTGEIQQAIVPILAPES